MTRHKKKNETSENTDNTRSGRARSSPEAARAVESRGGARGARDRASRALGTSRTLRPIRGANGDVPCVSTSTPHTATAPRAKSPGRLLNERCALSSSPATRARIAFPADASLSRGEVSPGRAPSPEARIVRVCRTSGRVGQESAAARPRVRGSMGRYVLLVLRRKKWLNALATIAEETIFFAPNLGHFARALRLRELVYPTYVSMTTPLRRALLCLLLLLERHPQVPAPHRHRADSRE